MAYEDIKLPYSLEAEQSVLGAVIIDPACINELVLILRSEHFYVKEHAQIYELMIRMTDLNKPRDFVTLLEEVRRSGIYGENDPKEYLVTLAQMVPTSANVSSYAKIVTENYYLRSLIDASRQNIEDASERNEDVRSILDAAENRIYGIMNVDNRIAMTHVSEALEQTVSKLKLMSDKDKRNELMGLSTGFDAIDHFITGLRGGEQVIIAARTGVGKTSLALNIATNVAKHYDKSVAIFSLEMSVEELASRIVSIEAMIDSERIRRGTLTDENWLNFAQAIDVLGKTRLYLDDTASITVTEMKAKLRRIQNLGLVIVDYLGLVGSSRRNENRVQEVSDISRSLKVMAKELKVPVICLSQLNRDVDKRSKANKPSRPMLADLRESGSIEQDADVVIMLHKDEFEQEDDNIMECIVAKNRHGETGTREMRWCAKFTKFFSIDNVHN